MRDYPNMSYCMCQNTLGAVRQIISAISEHDTIDEFVEDLSRGEQRALIELMSEMRQLIEMYDENLDLG